MVTIHFLSRSSKFLNLGFFLSQILSSVLVVHHLMVHVIVYNDHQELFSFFQRFFTLELFYLGLVNNLSIVLSTSENSKEQSLSLNFSRGTNAYDL